MNRYPLVIDQIVEKACQQRTAPEPDARERAYQCLAALPETELLVLFFQTDFGDVPPTFEAIRRMLYPDPQLVCANAA